MNNDNLISVDLGDDDIFADFKNKDGTFKRPPLSVVILVSSFCLMIICGLVLGGFVVYETYPDDPTTTTTQTPATTSTPEPTTTTSYPTVNEHCNNPSFVGDGYCDDDTNNVDCEFDKGDCCGSLILTQYCHFCECTQYSTPSWTTTANIICQNPDWIHDGYCDDLTNNEYCDWDGDDCCDPKTNKQYCNICDCPNKTALSTTTERWSGGAGGPKTGPTTLLPVLTTTIDNCHDDPNNSTVGDGYCDDWMNIVECNYDGGDCCGNNVTHGNCSACICINITEGASCADDPNNPMIGDGYCDDMMNNAECNYDGGDCCGYSIQLGNCSECACLNPTAASLNLVANIANLGCENAAWAGDGYCDDSTNTAECNFDDGDCCGANVNMQYCTECQCHSEGGIGNRYGCDNQDWVGDGYCDDIVNNPECNYDDGDCCGDNANVQYCIECKCFNEG